MTLFRNSLYSLAGSVMPLLVAIITIPIFVRLIGVEKYGILALVWLLVTYFSNPEIGLGRAIAQRISQVGSSDPDMVIGVIWSGLLGTLALFCITGAVLFGMSHLAFSDLVQMDEGLRDEVLDAVWLLVAFNPGLLLLGVLSGVHIGLNQFRIVSASQIIGNSLFQILPLVVAWIFDRSIASLILAALVGRLLGLIPLAAGVIPLLWKGGTPSISFSETGRLLHFGKWALLSALLGPLMIYADRFVIGAVLGIAAVTAYTIPFQLAFRTLTIPKALLNALFPRFASESEVGSRERCADFALFTAQGYALLVLPLICLADPLMRLWLGEALDERSILIARIVLAGCWITAVGGMGLAYIQARGDPRFVALLHVVELPIYAGILFLFTQAFGLAGAAAAFSLRCAVDAIILVSKVGVRRQVITKSIPQFVTVTLAVLAHPILVGWSASLFACFILVSAAFVCALKGMPSRISDRLRATPVGKLVGGLAI